VALLVDWCVVGCLVLTWFFFCFGCLFVGGICSCFDLIWCSILLLGCDLLVEFGLLVLGCLMGVYCMACCWGVVCWWGVVVILGVDVFYFEGGGPTVGFVCREQVKTLWTGVLVNIMFDR